MSVGAELGETVRTLGRLPTEELDRDLGMSA